MGRARKKSIDFAGWDVHIFDGDTKIDKLIDAQGWFGFSIYFFLCQKAYASEGYFYRWSYDDSATTARRMGGGIGSETVEQTVATCLQIGLFDKRLFDREGVLTSRGIQRRYAAAIQSRDIKTVNSAYWLLDEIESKGLSIVPENAENLQGKEDNLQGNPDSHQSKSHKSKVKESKVKESKEKDKGAQKRTTAAQLIKEAGFNPGLEQAVMEWVKYKTERREGYKETGLRHMLTQINNRAKEFGDAHVIDMLQDAMASNWSGFHLDRLDDGKKTTRSEQIRNRVKEVANWQL